VTSASVNTLLSGPNGLASVFSNTNANPALNFNGFECFHHQVNVCRPGHDSGLPC